MNKKKLFETELFRYDFIKIMTLIILYLNKKNYIQGCSFFIFSQEKSQNVVFIEIGYKQRLKTKMLTVSKIRRS